jgi:drug/metabolite transporter (DMT)-like permease
VRHYWIDGSPPKSPQTPRPVRLEADPQKGRLFLCGISFGGTARRFGFDQDGRARPPARSSARSRAGRAASRPSRTAKSAIGSGASLRLGWRGWLLALVGAAASIAFISAFKYTYVANVAVIYATSPFIAALLAFLLVREKFRLQTMLAAAVSLCGVAVMVGAGLGGGHLFGDGLALLMTTGSALYMIMVRAFRDSPVVWAGAVSAFLLFVLGWFVTDPLAVSTRDVVLLATFGCSFALASILWTEGSRLIPAAESGLLGSAEVPFAILFALLFLGEMPPMASMIGGAIVLCAVFAHAGRDWLKAKSARS